MNVLVCGGRDYADRACVWRWLDDLASLHGGVMVTHGACPTGADAHADAWARERGCHCQRFPARWQEFGRAAGPMRNQAMVDMASSPTAIAMLLAFPGGKGTADMVRRAKAAGLHVVEVPSGAP